MSGTPLLLALQLDLQIEKHQEHIYDFYSSCTSDSLCTPSSMSFCYLSLLRLRIPLVHSKYDRQIRTSKPQECELFGLSSFKIFSIDANAEIQVLFVNFLSFTLILLPDCLDMYRLEEDKLLKPNLLANFKLLDCPNTYLLSNTRDNFLYIGDTLLALLNKSTRRKCLSLALANIFSSFCLSDCNT